MSKTDLVGLRFGRLTVISFDKIQNGSYRWNCLCDCGKTKSVPSSRLKRDHTKSCGCLSVETRTKHGKSKTKLYSTWQNMKTRCFNENDEFYDDYGGRGIKVCEEWVNSFNEFYDWSMKNGYKDDLTIDRIDNNKNYSPDNCRWVNISVQANNKRNNVKETIDGEDKTLSEWAESTGINYKTIHSRYSRGDRGKRLIRGAKNEQQD